MHNCKCNSCLLKKPQCSAEDKVTELFPIALCAMLDTELLWSSSQSKSLREGCHGKDGQGHASKIAPKVCSIPIALDVSALPPNSFLVTVSPVIVSLSFRHIQFIFIPQHKTIGFSSISLFPRSSLFCSLEQNQTTKYYLCLWKKYLHTFLNLPLCSKSCCHLAAFCTCHR